MKRFTTMFCCIAAMVSVTWAAPIAGYFTQLDFDCGGYVTGFAMHPTGRIYCRANVGGLYRSDDHGETWQWLSSTLKTPACHIPWAIAVAPSDPDIVYQSVGTSYMASDPGRGVWKSVNGGTSWTQVLSGVNMAGNDDVSYGGPALILHPANENEVWTATRGEGLYRSLDAGSHWTRMGGTTFDGFVGAGFCIHPNFPDQIWIVGEGGLYVSVDRGSTWTKVKTCAHAYRVARFNDGTVLVIGVDNGSSFLWSITATDWNNPATYSITDKSSQFSDANDTMSLLMIAADDTTVWAGSRLVTKLSHDRGATWQKPAMSVNMSGYLPIWQRPDDTHVGWGRSEIAQDPLDPERWYMAGGNNPYVSIDGGATWRNLPRGIAEVCTCKPAFHPTKPDVVFIPAGDQYGMVITDGGRSGFAAHCLYTLTPGHIVAAGWHALVNGDRVIMLYNRYGTNGARLAVSDGDHGSWTEITPAGIPLDVFCDGAISIDNADDFLILTGGTTGSGTAGVYRTTDGGRHFTQTIGIPSGLFTGGNYTYFGYNTLHADPVNANRRYLLVPHRGFFRSDDRGVSWSELTTPLSGNAVVLAIDLQRTGRLWAASVSGQGLRRTDDGGDTWTSVGDFSFSDPRIDACGDRVVVFGRRTGDTWDKLYFSSDQGTTWGEITRTGFHFPTLNGVACDPHRSDRIWLSTSGRSSALFTITDDSRARDLAINTVNWEGRSAGTLDIPWFPPTNGAAGTTLVAGEGTWNMLRTKETFDRGTSVSVEMQPMLASGSANNGRARLGFTDGWPNTGRFVGLEFSGGELCLIDSTVVGAVRSLGAWTSGAWQSLTLTVNAAGALVISRPSASDETYAPATPLGATFRLTAACIATTGGITLRTPVSRTANTTTGNPTVITQPVASSRIAGQNATFTVVANGNPPLTYQWQRLSAGSALWESLSEGGSYAGIATSTLTVSATTSGMSGDQFRAVVTNSTGSITTSAATLTVSGTSLLQYPAGLALDSTDNI